MFDACLTKKRRFLFVKNRKQIFILEMSSIESHGSTQPSSVKEDGLAQLSK